MTDIVETLRDGCDCGSAKAECPAKEACQDAFDAADEIERLRNENEKLRAIIDQLRGVFFNGVYIAESKVAKLNLARAALGEKE